MQRRMRQRRLVSKGGKDEGMLAHLAWVKSKSGRPVTSNGYPKLACNEALVIMKVLLPLSDIKQELKLKNFTTLVTCVKDEHMRDYRCRLKTYKNVPRAT